VTKDEVLALLDKTLPAGGRGAIVLATWDGQHPRVRAMAVARDGLRFYIGSARNSGKVRDIAVCPEVEIIALLPQGDGVGQLRVAGKAVEIKGKALHDAWGRAKGYDVTFFMKGGLDDPGFAAFRIDAERALLMPPGTMDEEELSLSWFA
jgi:general stress protein 26